MPPITLAPQTFVSSEYTPNAQGQIIGLDKTGGSSGSGSLFQISNLNYIGAFRLNGGIFGPNDPLDSLRYQQRPIIALNNTTGNLLINGHGDANSRNIGEFEIPALVAETGGNFSSLNMAANTQNFVNVIDPLLKNDPTNSGLTISGLLEFSGEIIHNYFSFYDNAPGGYNTEGIGVIDNSSNLGAANVSGAFRLNDAARYVGWMSEIPPEWQSALGGTHLRGHSSGNTRTIDERHSNGPSAASFNAADLVGGNTPADGSLLSQNILLDYPLGQYLGGAPDYIISNKNEPGRIWTSFSECGFGFIIPGTSTYLCLGYSGGHNSGISYGPPPYGGFQGFYTNDQDDRYNYYWSFDVNDMVRVFNGEIQPHQVLPYAYGPLDIPFGGTGRDFNFIAGGAYDATNNILYLSLSSADDQTNPNQSFIPMVVAFNLGGIS